MKTVLKILASCLAVVGIGLVVLVIHSTYLYAVNNSANFEPPEPEYVVSEKVLGTSDLIGKGISRLKYRFLGKEYIQYEIGAEESDNTYTHITENLEEVPTDDLFHSDEIPRITSMKYLKMKSSETGTELATGEKYTSNEYFQYQFDNSGKLRRELYTDGGGNVWTYIYLYDSNDRLSAYVSRSYTGNTSLDKYEYDSNGRLILHSSQNSSSSETYETAWEYNDDGQVSQIDWSDYEGEHRAVFSYKNHNPTKETFYDDEELSGWRINSYDDKGRRIKTVKYSSDGTVEDTWVLEYDASGNCTLRARYPEQSTVADWEISYEYDSDGNQTLLKDKTVSDTRVDTTVTQSEYDNKGNLIKSTYETTGNSCEGSSLISTYTYDKNNNRIGAVEVYGAEDSTTYQYNYQSIYDHMTDHSDTFSDAFSSLLSKNPCDKFVGEWDLYYLRRVGDDGIYTYDNSLLWKIFDDGTITLYTDDNANADYTYEVDESNSSQIIAKESDSDDSIILSIDEEGIMTYTDDEIEMGFIRE